MKVKSLVEELNLQQITEAGEDREITGVYIGDLLSIVMNKCEEGNVWVTAQTHTNILSVADLNDVACVIIAGAPSIDENLKEKAQDAEIALLTTDKEAYEIAWMMHEVL